MTLVTKLPTLMRDVCAAAAVSVVQHSRTGSVLRPREMKWSQHQTPEKPARSACLRRLHPPRRRDADGRQVDPDRDQANAVPASSAISIIRLVAASRSSSDM